MERRYLDLAMGEFGMSVEDIEFAILMKDELIKKAIIARPSTRKNKKGKKETNNIKLGNISSWMMLHGNCKWYVPSLGIHCNGSCGHHCSGCFNPDDIKNSECYVTKSVTRHVTKGTGGVTDGECSVTKGHMIRTICMILFRDELFVRLNKQLTRERKNGVIRLNESGEVIYSETSGVNDLRNWNNLAKKHPKDMFYIYTKNYEALRELIHTDTIPNNFFILVSIWHEYGIKEFLEFANHPQIKAFVILDDEWTEERYARHGIFIQEICPAYNKDGTMNHKATCDKCKMCFNYVFKVIGVWKH